MTSSPPDPPKIADLRRIYIIKKKRRKCVCLDGGVKDVRASARTETSSARLRARDRSRHTESALWPEAPCPPPEPSKAPPNRLHVHTAPLEPIPGTLEDRKPDPDKNGKAARRGCLRLAGREGQPIDRQPSVPAAGLRTAVLSITK